MRTLITIIAASFLTVMFSRDCESKVTKQSECSCESEKTLSKKEQRLQREIEAEFQKTEKCKAKYKRPNFDKPQFKTHDAYWEAWDADDSVLESMCWLKFNQKKDRKALLKLLKTVDQLRLEHKYNQANTILMALLHPKSKQVTN